MNNGLLIIVIKYKYKLLVKNIMLMCFGVVYLVMVIYSLKIEIL